MYIYISICMGLFTCGGGCVCVWGKCVGGIVGKHVCVGMCVFVCVCLYVCVCVCMCVFECLGMIPEWS